MNKPGLVSLKNERPHAAEMSQPNRSHPRWANLQLMSTWLIQKLIDKADAQNGGTRIWYSTGFTQLPGEVNLTHCINSNNCSWNCYAACSSPPPAPHSQEATPTNLPFLQSPWMQSNPALSNPGHRIQIRISLYLSEESFLCPISLLLLFWISRFLPHYKLLQGEERSSYHVFLFFFF